MTDQLGVRTTNPNVPIRKASSHGSSSGDKAASEKEFADRVEKVPDHAAHKRTKHHHSSKKQTTRHVDSGTASSRTSRIEISVRGQSSSGDRTASEKELADRVETVGKHEARVQGLEKELERDQIKPDFDIAIEKCKNIGLSFSGEPGPGGNYRVASTSVGNSTRTLGLLYQLAVAAACVGEVRIVADVVLIAKNSKPDFDDPRYPIWRLIYEAAYERLDPNSPAAIALKEECGA